ncbi:COG1086 Predicted nucleoside-diphosphate sugar epimerases [Candidatus Nanopelagicaceae bacterium]
MGNDDFSGATICVTGGTGSFGSTMVRHLLNHEHNLNEIRVFSRDESKQDAMRNELQSERVKYYIGDVRDYSSVENVLKGTDYVFHASALKQVPSCEFFPDQALATNTIGSANVINASIKAEVKSLVCLSTDKAVYPINAMGISKAMMEKIAQAPARTKRTGKTTISVTRYGNVMMSRGSVIPVFIDQMLSGKEITVTDPKMTRFLMSLSESVDLVLHAFQNARPGDLFIRKAPACTIETLISGIRKILNTPDVPIRNIGIRHGEKMFESLLSSEEHCKSEDLGDYFRVAIDDRTLNYKIYFEEGQSPSNEILSSYTSDSTNQLSATQVADLIKELPEFKKYMESK